MHLDVLNRIENALARKREKIKVPYSRFDLAVLEALERRGYLESVARKGKGVKKIIEIKLKYANGDPAIVGLKFISRPSRRVYIGYQDLRKSHSGYGHFILSTPSGVKDGYQARKEKVGGELLFEVW
ncbi:MAG TPA: 30S ribosomal protein S8 [Candidatus Tyrphobacter sp.]|nr:30S ribosomal protein S8 [Candidatus Tyrphobacter sp.]